MPRQRYYIEEKNRQVPGRLSVPELRYSCGQVYTARIRCKKTITFLKNLLLKDLWLMV
jgi:hypothetical protein